MPMSPSARLDLPFEERLPDRRDRPIGVIGAGFIVDDIQLVAYEDAGFNIVALASRTASRAQDVAARHRIGTVYETWAELLDDERVEVVDIAFPPSAQLEIVRAACGRQHVQAILVQKPVATTYDKAVELVEICEAADKVLAVNQNMRFDQSMRALRHLLDRGDLGSPVLATIELRAVPHWQGFLRGEERLTFANMSIHHLDIFRFLFGEPEGIFVSARTDPRTEFPHRDGICLYVLEYASGLRASSVDDVWAGPVREGVESETFVRWRVEGTEGIAWGEIGWPAYPERRPSSLHFVTLDDPGRVWSPTWEKVWFPDAFQLTMGNLLGALDGAPLEIAGRENLGTMALVEAGYRSLDELRLVRVDEVHANGKRGTV